jgi:hypothetical protein
LKRMDRNDAMAAAVGILGLALAGHGKAAIGGLMLTSAIAYMWVRPRTPKAAPKPLTDSAVRDARALLGVGPDADAAAVRAAHRRLIALAHPDKGGTAALSAQINDARDLLLRHLAAHKKV